MSTKLVIVESPAKAKTINKILGGEFSVKACMGHVRDLPVKKLGVDLNRDFKPAYEIVKGREKIVAELNAAARKSAAVYLAPDPDREGEAIAWHLQALLADAAPADRFHRVTYHEITPRAVREAFAHPAEIDQHLVDAQQARRVLDRIVGYKVSPLLWSRVKRGLSAGRVQSVALRLVCEREDAIRNFVPQPYWVMGARVRKQTEPLEPFDVRLARVNDAKAQITTPEQAAAILADLDDRPLRVSDVIRRELQRRPPPPYITSSLQQAASRCFDFTPSRTMKVAQKLYEGVDLGEGPVGLITYMRTDAFHLSQEAVGACRAFIRQTYGDPFLPEQPNFFRSRSSAQEAHEAIRPTDVARTPESLRNRLSAEEQKLYSLIWQRFVACQMAAARIEQRTVEVEAVPPAGSTSTYLFRATASQVAFPGYMKVSGVEARVREKDADKSAGEDEEEIERLPEVSAGEALDRLEWLSERKETQPPGRYSEASLVKALEENGVGRPSTYAQILSTLHERKYVVKEKRALAPTPLGMEVFRFLVAHLNTLFEVKFTAGMESALDEVEQGTVDWRRMLADFYARFQEWVSQAKGPAADADQIARLVKALEGVTEWRAPVQRGKWTFSDQKFVESIRRQLGQPSRSFSERQLHALAGIAGHYRQQIPELDPLLKEMGLAQVSAAASRTQPPSAATLRKLELLRHVQCEAPVERRGRKFDDRAFLASIEQQAQAHRPLSAAQLAVVDRLLIKYAAQIPHFETVRAELGVHAPAAAQPDHTSGPLLDALRQVRQWHPAVQGGRRKIDDQAFYASLSHQFAARTSLSVKQVAALKRLARKYRAQIPNYPDLAAQHGIPEGKTPRERPAGAETPPPHPGAPPVPRKDS